MTEYVVTLYNQHAGCGIYATGRSTRQAFDRAMSKAGPSFTRYRRDHSALDGDETFAALFDGVRASFRRRKYGRVHYAVAGLGVELYKRNPADLSQVNPQPYPWR